MLVSKELPGPLLLTFTTKIPASIIEYIHDEMSDEITHPFPKFNGFIQQFIGWVILIHAGI